jgi:hypothetical protein
VGVSPRAHGRDHGTQGVYHVPASSGIVGAGVDYGTMRCQFAEQATHRCRRSAVGAHQGESIGAELVGGRDYHRWVLADVHVGGLAVE